MNLKKYNNNNRKSCKCDDVKIDLIIHEGGIAQRCKCIKCGKERIRNIFGVYDQFL